jgi:CheY-like chemotaxis protein
MATRGAIITILITDDDAEDREILREAIDAIDPAIEVVEAADGDSALKFLGNHSQPSLIMMDINMPLRDGFETLKEIKKRGNLIDIPVVMYSTSGSTGDVEKCKRLGAANFVVKPDSFEGLLGLLQPIIRSLV